MKITVSELNTTISTAIKENLKKTVTVVGEVSNPKVSGRHTYLTLKDSMASIHVAFWGQVITDKEAKHGDNVEITGKIDFYAKGGNVNLIGRKIEKVGIGSIHAQYEKIRDKYQKKGYFDNKKDLPLKIKDIGVVTAENGAALQDFIRVLRNNKFSGRVFMYNAVVQGPRCADSIASGIKFFDEPFYVSIDGGSNNNITEALADKINITQPSETCDEKDDKGNDKDYDGDDDSDESYDPFDSSPNTSAVKTHKYTDSSSESSDSEDGESGESGECAEGSEGLHQIGSHDEFEQVQVDAVVITRGGGSFEDLMGFSDPKVLEAIYKSKRYTVSSVGHEVDDMLSDFVANCCTGTPSMAGDLISQTCSAAHDMINNLEKRIMSESQAIMKKLYSLRQQIVTLENRLEDPIEKIKVTIQEIEKKALKRIWKSVKRYQRYNNAIIHRISTHDSTSLLKNGFSVIVDMNGKIVRDEVDLFNSDVKIIHETGEYVVKLCKVESDKN